MKKVFGMLAIILTLSFASVTVQAATGNVQVELPKEAENLTVHYTKIAEPNKIEDISYENSLKAEKGTATIRNLEEGIYQIYVSGDSKYEFEPSVISIPMWSEEEQKMLYDITMIPKYIENVQVVQTGDGNHAGMYMGIGLISVIIVVIISCHNRFKCGRMSE